MSKLKTTLKQLARWRKLCGYSRDLSCCGGVGSPGLDKLLDDAIEAHRITRELGELLKFEGCGCPEDDPHYDDMCFVCRVESILKGDS